MARKHTSSRIRRLLSGLFGGSQSPSTRRSTRKRSTSQAPQVTESLESRALLTLVGVDFGGGTTPANWSIFNQNTNQSYSDLMDDSGAATSIDLQVNVDSAPGGSSGFNPPAGDLPTHTASLAGLDGTYADLGNVTLAFSDLVANAPYELFVFAGDSFAGNQRVTVTGGTTFSFDQQHEANQLVINSEVGTSSRTLQSYALPVVADASGNLQIQVDSSNNPGRFFGLAGVAIQTPAPTFTVEIDAAGISEDGGATSGRIRRTGDTTSAVTVDLNSDRTDEAVVPATVTIPAGQSVSPDFSITAVDEFVVDGTQLVTITASAAGHNTGTRTLNVFDNEAQLTVSLAKSVISEADGATATTGTVTRNTPTDQPLAVSLSSSDTTEAGVVATVTIPAGQTSATFDVAAINDALIDGIQSVTITATAAGHAAGTAALTVTDDETKLTLILTANTISEADGAAATTARVTRSFATASPLTVMLMSSDTSEATVPTVVTIPANQTSSALFNVAAIQDTLVDGTQQVTLTAAASGYQTGPAVLNVTDDEGPGLSVTIAAASISEGAGSLATTATIFRNSDTTNALTVNLSSSDASEVTVPATVEIPAGQSSVVINLNAVDDLLVDGTQTTTITASAAGLTSGSDTVDVTDDDTPKLTLIVQADEINENNPAGTTATVSRNTDTTNALTVTLINSDSSAVSVPASVTIPAGQMTSAPFSVTGIDNSTIDGTRTVTLTAQNSAGGFADGVDALLVRDDETPFVTLSVVPSSSSDLNFVEDSGQTVRVVATLDQAHPFVGGPDVVINLTQAGTAMPGAVSGAGVDYIDPSPRQIVIPAGSTTGSLDFTIEVDTQDEDNETMIFAIDSSTLTGAEIETPQQVTATILDDDDPPVVSITGAANVTEGGAVEYTVSLSAASSKTITLNLATGGTATGGGADYVSLSSAQTPLVFQPGETSKTVTIRTVNDALDEPPETLILGVVGFTNAVGGPASQITTTIDDDDAPPNVSLQISSASVAENAGQVIVTAVLSEPSGQPVTVTLDTTPLAGTTNPASAADYQLSASQIVIPAGSTSGSVVLTATRDDIDEFDEVVDIAIDTTVNATPTGSPVKTTIIDANVEPTVTLSVDASAVDEDGGNVTFFATLDQVSGKPVTVNLEFLGEAAPGIDFTHTPLSVTIPAGSPSGTVTLTPLVDALDEFDELAVLQFVSVINGVENIVQNSSTVIRDINNPPEITLDLRAGQSDTIAEAGGSTILDVTLRDSAGNPTVSGKDVTVTLGLTGTAQGSGVDYHASGSVPVPTTIVIPAGSTTGSITLTADDDTLDEDDETIIVDILTATNATEVGTEQQTITITNDDPPSTLSLSINTPEIAEGGGQAVITASLDKASGRDVDVTLQLSGAATLGSDFSTSPAANSTTQQVTVTIPAGQTSVALTLTGIADGLDEDDENVQVTIAAAPAATVNTAADSVSTIIRDGDAPPVLDLLVDNSMIAENGGVATFTARLSAPSSKPVVIDLQLLGTASDGTDYSRPASLQLTIPAMSTQATFAVTAIQDTLNETDETVIVDVVNASNVTAGIGSATTTILNDDPVPVVSIATLPADGKMAEAGGSVVVTVSLNTASGRDVTVDLVRTGNATPVTDFTDDLTSQVTFAAGETSKTFTLTAVQDTTDELDEDITITLNNPVNATLGATASVIASITDDDGPPTVNLSAGVSPISEDGGQTVFTASLTDSGGQPVASGKQITIDLGVNAAGAGLADLGTDYQLSGTQIVIPAGSTSGSVTLVALRDNLDEFDEVATLSITGTTNAIVGTSPSASTTIQDIDIEPTVSLTVDKVTVNEDVADVDRPKFFATLDRISGKDVTVRLTFAGQATYGVDFTSTPAPVGGIVTVVIPAGSLQAEILIDPTIDSLDEFDELIELRFVDVTNGVENIVQHASTLLLDVNPPPTVSLALGSGQPAIITEPGVSSTVLEVVLSQVSDKDVTVGLTLGGVAVGGGVDYTATSTTITIPAGQLKGTLTLSVVDDAIDEEDLESIVVSIASINNATAAGIQSRTINVGDDDDEPTVSLSVNTPEFGEGGGVAVVTATLDVVSGRDVTVALAFSGFGPSPASPSDYTASATTITIPAGSKSRSINLTGQVDAIDEDDETVQVSINPVGTTNAMISATANTITSTIIDGDVPPTVDLTVDTANISENGGTATFTATLSAASAKDVVIGLQLSGTATGGGVDYTPVFVGSATPLQITIAAGATTGTVTVTADEDTLDEDPETVILEMLSATNAVIGTATQTTTIDDNDPLPVVSLSIDNANILEGGTLGVGGTGAAQVTVALDFASSKDVTVTLLRTGNAIPGTDFTGLLSTVTIPAGQQNVTFLLEAINDTLDEFQESITLTATAATNGVIGGSSQVTTLITDDDDAPDVDLSVTPLTISEDAGQAVFTATLSTPSGKPVTVILTPGGDATIGDDYQLSGTTINIPAGSVSGFVTVTALRDDKDEPNEDVTMTISSATNATPVVIGGTPTTTITDIDIEPTVSLSVSSPTVQENAGTVTFFATLNAVSGKDVTVELEFGGEAQYGAGLDFTSLPALQSGPNTLQVTIPAGQTVGQIVLTLNQDNLDEFDELVELRFVSVTNGVENIVQHASTLIVDTDSPPTVSLVPGTLNPITEAGADSTVLDVLLNTVSGKDVTVTLGLSGTAAGNGVDYTSTSTTIVIPAGQLSRSLTLTAVNDLLDEVDPETIIVDILTIDNATAAGAQQQTINIADDDDRPVVSLSVDPSTIAEAGGVATVTATLNTRSGQDVLVDLGFSGVAGVTDYSASASSILIPAGQLSGTITLTGLSDNLDEAAEDIIVTALQPTTPLATVNAAMATVTATIMDSDNPPTVDLAVNNASIAENGGSAVFTATLAQVSTFPVEIDVTLTGSASGTAPDYSVIWQNPAQPGRILIPAGSLTGSFTVNAEVDTLNEDPETVIATITSALTGGVQAPIGTGTATTTIVDDDALPVVSIAVDDAAISETGGQTMVRVTLDTASSKDVTVVLQRAGSATSGVDFAAVPASVTIAAGTTEFAFPITALTDDTDEFDENVTLTLTSPVNAIIGTSSEASTLILDDDAPPSVTLTSGSPTVVEDGGQVTLTATLDRVSGKQVVVNLLASGAATLGTDYQLSSTQIIIPAGRLTGTVTLTALRDDTDEPNEVADFQIDPGNITNATAAGGLASTEIIDIDIEPTVTLSVSSPSVLEDVGTVTFFATLDVASAKNITVNLKFDGEATPGTDFTHSSLSVDIPAGALQGSVIVTVIDDAIDEFDELVVLEFVSVINGVENIVQHSSTTIRDNDAAPTVSLQLADSTITEAAQDSTTLNVVLSAASEKAVTVFLTTSGNATGGGIDFTGGATSVLIPAGQTVMPVTFTAVDDTLNEFDEIILVEISSVTNGDEDGVQAQTITVIDDDPLPNVALSIDLNEISETGGVATVTASLTDGSGSSIVSGRDVVVALDYSGAAVYGTDFTAPTSITIPAGQSSASIVLTASSDLLNEFSEAAIIQILQSGTPFATASGTGVFTEILDDDPLPTVNLSVDLDTISETGGTATFTATLTTVSGRDVTVNLLISGSATGGGVDYDDPATLQIVIPAGNLSASLTIDAVADLLNEDPETVSLQIDAPTGVVDYALVGDDTATTTIVDDDPLPVVSLSINAGSIAEASGQAVVTVSLSAVSGRDVIVDLQSGGVALSGIDYTGLPSQITIPAGASSAMFTITATDDRYVEADESVILSVSGVQNATSDGNSVSTVISDNDVATLTLTLADAVVNEADGDSATFLTIHRNTSTSTPLPINLTSSDTGEATVPGGLIIPAGAEEITVPVRAINDLILDGTQSVTFSATSTGFVTGLVNLLVEDAATSVNLSVSTASGSESGQTVVTIFATAAKPVIGIQTLDLAVSGIGISPEDYLLANTTLTFQDGQQIATTTFTVQDDSLVEALLETATVSIVGSTAGLTAGSTATVDIVITDDDAALLSIDDVTVTEGHAGQTLATFTVTLDRAVDGGLTVDYSTGNNTATAADGDFVAALGTLSFNGVAGETRTITIDVTGDTKVELNEQFTVDLANIVAPGRDVAFARSQGLGTIINDDSAGISISDVTVLEGDSGSTAVVLAVTLNAEVDAPILLDYATADGTATVAGLDLTAASGQVAFAANSGGAQTVNITIQATGDEMVELDEQFFVNLTGLLTAGRDVTITDSQAVATIQNDDQASLSINDVTQAEGHSGNTVYTFTVTLDKAVDQQVVVDIDTVDATAGFGEDYVPNTGSSLIFNGDAGETLTFSVTVVGDTRVEQDEAFHVLLSNVIAGGRDVIVGKDTGIGLITNDDFAELTINDVTITEGDAGTQNAVFTVTLSNEVDADVTVNYGTIALTASAADLDYTATSGTLTFIANSGGAQSASISVPVIGDRKVELDETFGLELSGLSASSSAVTIADVQGVATITNDDTASVTITDVTQVEGNSGTTTFSFLVELDAEIDTAMTVDFSNTSGTATVADGDFTAISGGQLIFAANTGGAQTQVLEVEVSGDTKVERDETFLVSLANLMAAGRNVTLATTQATGTILNDDRANLSINDVAVAEGDAGTTPVTFTITLDAEVDTDVTFSFGTSPGTASPTTGDYTPNTSNVLTFAGNSGGAQTHQFTVNVHGDERVELDETFFANLRGLLNGGRNVVISDAQGVATITNDDQATITIDDVTQAEGASGQTFFNFTVTLDAEVDVPVHVNYATLADTATAADSDYVPVSGRLTFAASAAGQTQTIAVAVNGDAKLEPDETFLVDLLNLQASGRNVLIPDPQGLGTITNDDEATITVADVRVQEGNAGTSNLVFEVTLNAEVTGDVTVSYAVADGTATAGSDYSAVPPGTLTFNASAGSGPQTRTITVPIRGDRIVEADETVIVTLSDLVDNGQGVTLGNTSATGTIANDETATLRITNAAVDEGNTGTGNVMTFVVTLDTQVDTGFSVAYEVLDGTATLADNDYLVDPIVPLVFTGTIGETRTITVQARADLKGERDETVLVNLLPPAATGRDISVSNANGVGTIRNDDVAELRISDATVVEGDAGTRQAVFTVTLTGEVDSAVRLNYTTVDNTATSASGDYTRTSGTLNLSGAAGSSATISVPVNGDTMVENDESFFVDLSQIDASGRNVLLADSRGLGTIINDDIVNVSVADVSVQEGYLATGTTLTFTVTRSNNSVPTTVTYATADGTATLADDDYVAISGALTMAAGGPLSQTVTVDVVGDHRIEGHETVLFNIASTSTGATVTRSQATGTILQDDGSISGRKWHDANGDGVQDVSETGLSGWVIQVLDGSGNVVTSTVTGADGQYSLPVNQGTWNVQEVLQDGWRQTFPDSGDALAFSVDQTYGLRFSGNLFENWGGLGEKWLRGNDGWFFITPAGNLFEWDGSPRKALTGELVASLGSRFHSTPSQLYDARDTSVRPVTVAASQTVGDIDFGNIPTGLIQGRKWHDINNDGVRDATEPWLNGWTITLSDQQGNVLGTAVTADLDLNGDGQIDPATEIGWYRFSSLLPGTYNVSEVEQQGWGQSGVDGSFAREAYRLDQERNFQESANDFLNWGGRQERWLYARDGFHFITPDGKLYKWNKSPRTALTGQLVATLDASYWNDLSLLYNARRPVIQQVEITGQEVSDIHFGNTFGHNRTGGGNVTAVVTSGDLVVTGDSQNNTVVVHLSPSGMLYVTGVDGTTVNGQSVPFAATTTGANGVRLSSVNLGGGNDQLLVSADATVGASGTSTLSIESGTGNDLVIVSRIQSGRSLTLSNAGGNDVRRIQSSRLSNVSLTGGGSVAVENSTILGTLSSASSAASTTVIVHSAVQGTTNLNGSSAADTMVAAFSVFRSAFQALGGSGNDVLALQGNQFDDTVLVDGQSGNDTLGLRNSNVFGASATFAGGDGIDTLAANGAGPQVQTSSIESSNNSTLDNLIDLALSSFEDLLLDI